VTKERNNRSAPWSYQLGASVSGYPLIYITVNSTSSEVHHSSLARKAMEQSTSLAVTRVARSSFKLTQSLQDRHRTEDAGYHTRGATNVCGTSAAQEKGARTSLDGPLLPSYWADLSTAAGNRVNEGAR
jgi:hypothetical protein